MQAARLIQSWTRGGLCRPENEGWRHI